MAALRIVFIDKDSEFLDDLKQKIKTSGYTWETFYFTDEIKALKFIIHHKKIDIAISNLNLKRADGISILTKVMDYSPDTSRILATEYPERQVLRPNITIAQQLIQKPYQPDFLDALIHEIHETRHYLENIALENIISQIDVLPSLPDLYAEITKELNSDQSSIKNIGAIITKDIGMTAKIIKLANSPYFGLRQKLVNVDEAVMMLGLDIIKSLVLYLHIFTQFTNPKIPKSFISNLWNHGLKTARLAEKIALTETKNKEVADAAFLGGLLHDTGKLIFAEHYSDTYIDIIDIGDKGLESYSILASEEYEATHADIGAYLMSIWHLPDEIAQAAYFHNKPHKLSDAEETFGIIHSVFTANVITSSRTGEFEKILTEFDPVYQKQEGFHEKLSRWTGYFEEINADKT